jgi:hypothetical protein
MGWGRHGGELPHNAALSILPVTSIWLIRAAISGQKTAGGHAGGPPDQLRNLSPWLYCVASVNAYGV